MQHERKPTMLLSVLGPWIYWPVALVCVSGSITWTVNCISVVYSEVGKQIEELRRTK